MPIAEPSPCQPILPARLLARAEVAVGLFLTAVIGLVHLVNTRHAGPLWRDEVSALHVATLPSLGGLWSKLEHDSAPLGWFLILRGWHGLGLGATEGRLRLLGLLVGLGTLAALWWSARKAGARAPLVSLALVGLCPAVFRHSDTLRPYGAGALFTVLALATSWRLVERCSRWRVVACAAACLAPVHTLYHDAAGYGGRRRGGEGDALYRTHDM